jgi:hypothetical protein
MPRSPAAAFRDRVKEFRRIPVADLQDNAGNWRRHPQAQQDALTGVLKEIGIAGALLAYYSEREGGALTLIDGHLRRQTGGEWPVLILDVDDAEADLLLATYDPLAAAAQTDKAQLTTLLHQVSTGDAAVQALLSQLAQDTGVVPRDTPSVTADPDDDAPAGAAGSPRLVTCPTCGDQFPLPSA